MAIVPATSAFQSFCFESVDVRIVDVDGAPWFVATDVLAATRTTRPVTTAVQMIEEDLGEGFTNSKPLKTSGGTQEVLILHEAAVTLLISRSRTPMGKAFNRHLHSVILPTIRKTGKFVAHPEFEDDRFESAKRELKAAQSELMEVQAQITRAKTSKLKQALSATPKITKDSTFDEILERMFPLIAAFCDGKTKVSTTEILQHLGTQNVKPTYTIQRIVIICLRRIGFEKNGERHHFQFNGRSQRVWTWLAF
jgi:prophage antirepressor-like protein